MVVQFKPLRLLDEPVKDCLVRLHNVRPDLALDAVIVGDSAVIPFFDDSSSSRTFSLTSAS